MENKEKKSCKPLNPNVQVEARAVGEYVTAHTDQPPAPFVVLSRQLSMAMAYSSLSLDPSQARYTLITFVNPEGLGTGAGLTLFGVYTRVQGLGLTHGSRISKRG